MTISRLRDIMYHTAKILGDVQAVTHRNPGKVIPKRIGRRIIGRLTARLISSLFPPTRK